MVKLELEIAMKKRSCSSSSSVFEEANGVEDEAEPQQPSSCAAAALDELHKEKNENGEETLVPPNPNLDDGFYEIETIRRKRLRKVTITKNRITCFFSFSSSSDAELML